MVAGGYEQTDTPDLQDNVPFGTALRQTTLRAPSVIEVPTDNGSPYIAKDTQIFARRLGPQPCFTPARSPQGNGMSEAVVETLKRGYVQATPLPDAQTVLGLIGSWTEDHNDTPPHSGLKMRSPRKFVAAQTAIA